MSKFFVEPDGADEPTIWEDMQGHAAAVVVRKAELPGPHTDLLWRVLTGVLCANDETVERVARRTFMAGWGESESGWDTLQPFQHDFWRRVARATLAALRDADTTTRSEVVEVPHEHQWIDVTQLSDPPNERRFVCNGCPDQRTVTEVQ